MSSKLSIEGEHYAPPGRAVSYTHLDVYKRQALVRGYQLGCVDVLSKPFRVEVIRGLSLIHIYTAGFNPHAFVSIPLPLSVGYSSACEVLECQILGEQPELDRVPERMNAVLPAGISVSRCYEAQRAVKELAYVNYIVTLEYEAGAPFGVDTAIQELLSRESLVMRKKSKKAKSGFTEVDLIPLIARATVEERRDTVCLLYTSP